jgi:hypothetical protein
METKINGVETKSRILKKQNKKLYMLAKNTFPSYNGRVYIIYTDSVVIKNTKYVNGTKSMYRLINLENGEFITAYTKDDDIVNIPMNHAVIQYNCVSGVDIELLILTPLVIKF